ncbi:hypothetical protein D3C76_1730130 [compost metagenome]
MIDQHHRQAQAVDGQQLGGRDLTYADQTENSSRVQDVDDVVFPMFGDDHHTQTFRI